MSVTLGMFKQIAKEPSSDCLPQVLALPAVQLLWIWLLTALSADAHSASFDCTKASVPTEIAVCQSGELGILDEDMAILYKRLSQDLTRADRVSFEKSQKAFLRRRNKCVGDVLCIREVYQDRIEELRDTEGKRITPIQLIPTSFVGRCLLEVDGRLYIDGVCPFLIYKDGSFIIGSDGEAIARDYFAVVNVTQTDTADAFWNEEAGASHAHSPLGKVYREGACWANSRARICAWK